MNLHQHLDLLGRFDRARALRRLIERAVEPGCRVLDAGCGTGVLSVWAARAGAAEVVGIDLADVSLAERLARDNGCGEIFRARRISVEEYCESPERGRFDLVLALLYFNDPRRDEGQAHLARRLRASCLAPGGAMIPDRVRYSAAVWEWPAQDVARHRADLASRVAAVEVELGLDLGAFRDRLLATPDLRFFPRRGTSGCLAMNAAERLSSTETAFELDYRSGRGSYPPAVELPIVRSGLATCLVWTQALLAGDELVFSNDSVSWVRTPCRVEAGVHCRAELDAGWRASNQLELLVSGAPVP